MFLGDAKEMNVYSQKATKDENRILFLGTESVTVHYIVRVIFA